MLRLRRVPSFEIHKVFDMRGFVVNEGILGLKIIRKLHYYIAYENYATYRDKLIVFDVNQLLTVESDHLNIMK